MWKLPKQSREFQEKFDCIQGELAELAGRDDLLTGVLSKAKGQILRAAAVLLALFRTDPSYCKPEDLSSKELSTMSIKDAINLIEVSNEHTALIGGRKGITAPITLELSYVIPVWYWFFCSETILNYKSHVLTFTFFIAVSPQGTRQACDDESNAAFVLTLPGKVMDLTSLLNNKKFRGRGNKKGAIRVFQLLQNDDLGNLETRRGRSHSKVCLLSVLFM